MHDLMISIFKGGVLVGIGMALYYFRVLSQFQQALRKNHPDIWANLGSPSFLNTSISNSRKMTRYIMKKEYLTLGADLARRAQHLRIMLITNRYFIVVMLSLFALIIFAPR